MIIPKKLTLSEKVKLYATGDKEKDFPAHAFDFSYEDADNIMSALRIVWLLSRIDIIHNYQAERGDIKKFCIEANGVIRTAKNFIERCPIKAQFRLSGAKMDGKSYDKTVEKLKAAFDEIYNDKEGENDE